VGGGGGGGRQGAVGRRGELVQRAAEREPANPPRRGRDRARLLEERREVDLAVPAHEDVPDARSALGLADRERRKPAFAGEVEAADELRARAPQGGGRGAPPPCPPRA